MERVGKETNYGKVERSRDGVWEYVYMQHNECIDGDGLAFQEFSKSICSPATFLTSD